MKAHLAKLLSIAAISLAFLAGCGEPAEPTDAQKQAMQDRLAKTGTVCTDLGEGKTEGCDDIEAVASTGGGAGAAKTPEGIYKSNCAACHASGVAGAPVMGDAGAWSARIAKGADELFNNAWNGFNAMPAKGMCGDCTEDDIKGAVQYMVDASK